MHTLEFREHSKFTILNLHPIDSRWPKIAMAASTAVDFPDTGSPIAMVGGVHPQHNRVAVDSGMPLQPHQGQAEQRRCHSQRKVPIVSTTFQGLLLHPNHLKEM